MMFTLSTFYRSGPWILLVEQLRLKRVGEDGHLRCEHCGKPITHKYDCIGHHKTELTESNVNDYSISLNPDNVALVHHRCHNQIHERFGFQSPQKVYLVYGSPCSGKSSFVADNAGRGDLVVDLDTIWQAVSINDRYDKPDVLKPNVFGVRDCLLDMIKCRHGKWRSAWIIGGYPLMMERQRLYNIMGCSPVFIDTDRETCILRAKDRGRGWERFVADWWEKFQPDLPPVGL